MFIYLYRIFYHTVHPLCIYVNNDSGTICTSCHHDEHKKCITCIFTACDDLYTQAVEFSKKCSRQVNTIQQLESRLVQQLAANKEKDIVQHSLVKLQEEMEIISLLIKRHQEALQKSISLC